MSTNIDALRREYGITSMQSAATQSKDSNMSLSFEDYLGIVVAQLQNQDMSNPSDTSDFINQMVQYSTIQVMNEMNQMSLSNYAMGFVGKDVVIAESDTNGNLNTISGIVEGVTLYSDSPMVLVDGVEYSLNQVMIAGKPSSDVVEDTEVLVDRETE